jgi:hypothetical protein
LCGNGTSAGTGKRAGTDRLCTGKSNLLLRLQSTTSPRGSPMRLRPWSTPLPGPPSSSLAVRRCDQALRAFEPSSCERFYTRAHGPHTPAFASLGTCATAMWLRANHPSLPGWGLAVPGAALYCVCQHGTVVRPSFGPPSPPTAPSHDCGVAPAPSALAGSSRGSKVHDRL